ncbi:Peptidase family S41 [Parapedobacter composti]|uniref:Peptidase family S41 n=1 Tax=Parapedobacter composti TaxID=623281 RepID=A0A1I1DXR3_9SPHI|nr:S41 family peptidase [Parapedobacter composti]SFB77393.1 Peptidase family S41 [Parapedobacter composti]
MTSNRILQSVAGLVPMGVFFAILLVSSCKDDTPRVTHAEINQWIVDSMRYWYYWSTAIPDNNQLDFNASPETFFARILNKPTDRFSVIAKAEDLKNQSAGIIRTSGLGFAFFGMGSGRAGVVVRYVLEGSPADKAGIERGDIFTRVNGMALTVDNGGAVQNYGPLQGNETFRLTKGILEENGTIREGGEVSLTPVAGFQEKAIHKESVITTDNGTKVAYLFYNRFLNQPQELVDAFGRFKAAGVTELIVDERYNLGGSVEIAALLSALIHQGFAINSPFIQYDFNSNFNDVTRTYADMFGAVNGPLVANRNLGLSRVFILATRNSASASELLINNLRPFLGMSGVIHIGSTTYGKDEASIIIENSSPRFDGQYAWGIQPIVLKYKNKDGVGDFGLGIQPTYEVQETLPFAPIGSPIDPLIAKALSIIDPGMQAGLNRQMGIESQRRSIGAGLLEAANKDLAKPRPLDVTESLKGGNALQFN